MKTIIQDINHRLLKLPEDKLIQKLAITIFSHTLGTLIDEYSDTLGIKHIFFYFAEDSRKAILHFILNCEVLGDDSVVHHATEMICHRFYHSRHELTDDTHT